MTNKDSYSIITFVLWIMIKCSQNLIELLFPKLFPNLFWKNTFSHFLWLFSFSLTYYISNFCSSCYIILVTVWKYLYFFILSLSLCNYKSFFCRLSLLFFVLLFDCVDLIIQYVSVLFIIRYFNLVFFASRFSK